jgi:hypothetical protein
MVQVTFDIARQAAGGLVAASAVFLQCLENAPVQIAPNKCALRSTARLSRTRETYIYEAGIDNSIAEKGIYFDKNDLKAN